VFQEEVYMSYDYNTEIPALMNPKGVIRIIDTLEKARTVAEVSGVFEECKCYSGTGDGWHLMAAVDFLVTHGYLNVVAGIDGPRQRRVLRVVEPS
jgi:hypothetical protein